MSSKHILSVFLLIFALTLLSSGCANSFTEQPDLLPTGAETGPEHSATEEDPGTGTPDIGERRPEPTLPGGLERVTPIDSDPVVGEVPAELLDEMIADLAQETGADRDDIKVVRAEAVVWNDGSLGCPKPGEFYIQVLMSGYWVVLEVEAQEYDYRANDAGYFTLCEGKGGPPMPPRNKGVDIENPLIIQAKEDLAERLDISPNQIALLSFEAVVWPDSSLGCPQPGMFYAQVLSPGYRVILEVNGERYMYHTDNRQRVVYCGSEGAGRLLGGESTETVSLAKDDLARRLGISADSIDIVAVTRQEFPADAFYCRMTKERVARDDSPAVIPGESVLMSAAGRKYEYHTSNQTIIFCRQLR
jgi:hypothetical protein